MEVIGGYIGAVLIYALFISIIGGWIFVGYYKINCRKVKKCKNDKCLYRQFCDHKVMTDAEREKLKNLMMEYCRQNNLQFPEEK